MINRLHYAILTGTIIKQKTLNHYEFFCLEQDEPHSNLGVGIRKKPASNFFVSADFWAVVFIMKLI